MGYADTDNEEQPVESPVRTVISILVRTLGVLLLVAGLILVFLVIREALGLYKYPERVEVFAATVEQGSNIDKTLAPWRTGDDLGRLAIGESDSEQENSIRLSYFFAWLIVFGLLLLLSKIAIGVVTTGGKLALYDPEVNRLARALIEESKTAYR
tara:strand:+ start:73 stop:537 length:465 start_codon:yes stop_codon:yes gene_type:complete